MDNAREFTSLFTLKNSLKLTLGGDDELKAVTDYITGLAKLKEQISKCSKLLPESLSDKLSSHIDDLSSAFSSVSDKLIQNDYNNLSDEEITSLTAPEFEKIGNSYLALTDLYAEELYDIYSKYLYDSVKNGELTDKDLVDIKNTEGLSELEKELIDRVIETIKKDREIEEIVENAEQQSMEEDKKGKEEPSVSLTDLYNELTVFRFVYEKLGERIANQTEFTEEILNQFKTDFTTINNHYDKVMKSYDVTLSQLTPEMFNYYFQISNAKVNIQNIINSESKKLEEREAAKTAETKEESQKAESAETSSREQQIPSLEDMIRNISYDPNTNIKVEVEKVRIQYELDDVRGKIQSLIELSEQKRAQGKNLTVKEAIELHKLCTMEVSLEKMLSNVEKLTKIEQYREDKMDKLSNKISEKQGVKEELVQKRDAKKSKLGRWISNKKIERIDKKIAKLQQDMIVAIGNQKEAVSLSYNMDLKMLKIKSAFEATTQETIGAVQNAYNEAKNIVSDAKEKYRSTKKTLGEKIENIKKHPIFMRKKPATANYSADEFYSEYGEFFPTRHV